MLLCVLVHRQQRIHVLGVVAALHRGALWALPAQKRQHGAREHRGGSGVARKRRGPRMGKVAVGAGGA